MMQKECGCTTKDDSSCKSLKCLALSAPRALALALGSLGKDARQSVTGIKILETELFVWLNIEFQLDQVKEAAALHLMRHSGSIRGSVGETALLHRRESLC